MNPLLFGVLATCLLLSCERKEQTAKSATVPLKIRLTDQPAVYDSVMIQLRSIQVQIDNEDWFDLATPDTMVNLLDLQNGITLDIAQGQVTNGTLHKVRFKLGDGNYLVQNGQRLVWKSPGLEHPGFTITVNQDLNNPTNNLTFDFVVNESIGMENGVHIMTPVIQLVP